ncbi:CD3337/EF1877 family mobilome membrane protein [Hazenella coriacea]|uniref:TrbL/VirB6 plasmid conjugal transfer protein n=1 Tax=Hazenella coriacea TaxID=1179467 RepID=A0A4V2UVT3_9BACL|nr:type IV secretion system protein [Hazenella coriacea]TCS96957.1 TrbL/VirB6 plasmid conjugal transfer protein [Hazenella coriacea]
MNKRRTWMIFLTLLIWITVIPGTQAVYAEEKAEQSSEGFSLIGDILTIFPEDKIKEAEKKGYNVKYSKYPPSRYYLDINLETGLLEWDKKVSNQGHSIMNDLNNFGWQSILTWDFTVIMIVENAFSLDIVNEFADSIEKSVQQLAGFNGSGYGKTGLMGNFLTLMIILAGAWIAYTGMIQKKTTKALTGMLSSLLILVLGLAFFANVGGVMRYVNDISSGLNQEVMGVGVAFQQEMSGDEAKYPADVSSMVVADQLYTMLIYEPYLMLQYGKTANDPSLTPERIRKILDHKPGSTSRAQAVLNERNGVGHEPNVMVTSDGVFQRLTLLIMLFISHVILGFLFLLIAGAMLVFQFIFVLATLFAPFAFLMGLHPTLNSVATAWFKKFIGYQLVKLIIGVFFSMLLTISQFLYQMSPPEKVGYVWTIAMQVILVMGVVWKRDELFSILKAPMGKVDDFKGELNIKLPVTYVTKYSETMAARMKKINAKRK